MSTPRRSGRKRKYNARYSEGASGIDLGSDESEEVPGEDVDDDIFALHETNSAEENSIDDAELTSGEDADIVTVIVGDEENHSANGRQAAGSVPSAGKSTKASQKGSLPRQGIKTKVSRGLPGRLKRHVKSDRIRHTYGPTTEDLIPYVKNRDLWSGDVTLPSYFAPSAYHSEAMAQFERGQGWNWYIHGGRETFARKQTSEAMPDAEALPYVSAKASHRQTLRIGPFQSQQLYSLEGRSFLRLPGGLPEGEKGSALIVNLGAKIQCLDWLPNNDCDEQFLAVSCLQNETSDQPEEAATSRAAPAFTASRAFPASTQIWRIKGSTNEEEAGLIRSENSATLDTVLCHDWGQVVQFRWCPMPGPPGDQQPRGLLAGVWSDGTVRVLDIHLDTVAPASTRFLHITDCAFAARFPQEVVPSCITWLSTSSLAVGCANGHVAIWALPSHFTASESASPNPQPWFYRQLHNTYILSITSGYPSRPYLLFTSSMDGYLRETDLRAPDQDYCLSSRLRFGTVAVAWHDRAQSLLSVDEVGVMRANTARRFFQSVEVCRTAGQVADLRTSPLHASVLTAQLDGSVFVTNPMRRVTNMKADAWRQAWFQYEWRRGLSEEQIRQMQNARRSDQAGSEELPEERLERLREPMGRFLEGLKVELVAGPTADYQKFMQQNHTVYEKETAITQVAWNPNPRFGGWAAAGTGSGLVRIENLAAQARG